MAATKSEMVKYSSHTFGDKHNNHSYWVFKKKKKKINKIGENSKGCSEITDRWFSVLKA